MGNIIMFRLLSSVALVQAAMNQVDVDKKKVTTHKKVVTRHVTLSHKIKKIAIHKVHHINGVARLHYCMDAKHHVVPCSHVMDNFSYSKNLIKQIMHQLPRFVHKHTVVYRMYTTLKLYYLHQQELLAEVLAILKQHMHSQDLAKQLHKYISQMHGGNFGWVKKISTLLKSHM